LGKPLPDALLQQDEARQQIEDADRRVLTGGETVETIATMRFADGTMHRLHQVKTPLRGLDGAITGLVAVSTDVTAELQAREQEQLTHRRLQDAVESFPGAFALFDSQERLLLWNSKLGEWFPELDRALRPGLPFAELVDMSQARLPGFSEEWSGETRLGQDAQADGSRTWEVRTTDGRWLQLVRAHSGSGIIRVGLDVTERKLREQELRQAQKMEAVGQLTGGIAHDFNNLLTAMMGYGQLLLDHLRGDQAGQAMGQAVLAAVQRGSALTQRLLAYARRQPLNPVELDLNRLVSGMEELIRRTLGEDIEIELVQGGGLWKTMADTSQVEDALLNLALN
ncbi:MAG TPA: PAS-domain containing protein, partial [bacterium]|nr:PAS-domain containing protein [bacterium]